MLVKVDEIQNRIKEDLKSEEKRNLERDKQKTDTIKRIGKEINKSVKKIINDIGFTVTNRDEGKGYTDNSFGRLSCARLANSLRGGTFFNAFPSISQIYRFDMVGVSRRKSSLIDFDQTLFSWCKILKVINKKIVEKLTFGNSKTAKLGFLRLKT